MYLSTLKFHQIFLFIAVYEQRKRKLQIPSCSLWDTGLRNSWFYSHLQENLYIGNIKSDYPGIIPPTPSMPHFFASVLRGLTYLLRKAKQICQPFHLFSRLFFVLLKTCSLSRSQIQCILSRNFGGVHTQTPLDRTL